MGAVCDAMRCGAMRRDAMRCDAMMLCYAARRVALCVAEVREGGGVEISLQLTHRGGLPYEEGGRNTQRRWRATRWWATR